MAKKGSLSKDSDSSESATSRDASRGDNGTRYSAERVIPRGEIKQEALAIECGGPSKGDVLTYAVPWLDHTVPQRVANLAGGHTFQYAPLPAMEKTTQTLGRDVTDRIDPSTALGRGVARRAEQPESTSAHSVRFEERLRWLVEASEWIDGILWQVRSRMPYCLPAAGRARRVGAPEEVSQESGTSCDDVRLPLSMVRSSPIAIGATQRVDRVDDPHQDRLYGFTRPTSESARNHQGLANAACVALQAALRQALSLKDGLESAVASLAPLGSSPRTWIPHHLAWRVSRVQYYSKNYAEEVSSAPLEVCGYTLRLSVRCAIEAGHVSLSFSLKFCASASNESVQWPFKGALLFIIHHPTDPARSRRYSVHPSRPEETIMPRKADNVPLHLVGPLPVLTRFTFRFQFPYNMNMSASGECVIAACGKSGPYGLI